MAHSSHLLTTQNISVQISTELSLKARVLQAQVHLKHLLCQQLDKNLIVSSFKLDQMDVLHCLTVIHNGTANTNNLPSTIMAPPVDYATTERALSNLFTHPDSEAPITAAVTENSEPLMTRLHVMDRVENDGKFGEEVEPRAVNDQDDQTAAKPEDQMRREIEGGLDPSLNLIHSSEEMLVAEVQRLRQALSSTGYEMGETQQKGAGSEPVVQKGTPPGVLLPK